MQRILNHGIHGKNTETEFGEANSDLLNRAKRILGLGLAMPLEVTLKSVFLASPNSVSVYSVVQNSYAVTRSNSFTGP